jgi:hypothetical protein
VLLAWDSQVKKSEQDEHSPALERRFGIFAGTGLWYSNMFDDDRDRIASVNDWSVKKVKCDEYWYKNRSSRRLRSEEKDVPAALRQYGIHRMISVEVMDVIHRYKMAYRAWRPSRTGFKEIG